MSKTILQTIRLEKGMSQYELAEKSGVNYRTLQDFDQGRKSLYNAKGDMLIKLSNALEVPIESLLGSDNENRLLTYYDLFNRGTANMSRLLSKAKVYLLNAEFDRMHMSENNAFLDSCCFNLQLSIELSLIFLVKKTGGNYADDHDILVNLDKLSKAGLKLPLEKEIREISSTLYEWKTESRCNESFTSAIADVDEAFRIAKELIELAEKTLA